jgi:hypothetical protein
VILGQSRRSRCAAAVSFGRRYAVRYRMNITTMTSAMGSIVPTTNAKILNAASPLMMHLIALRHGRLPSVELYARGAFLFPRALPHAFLSRLRKFCLKRPRARMISAPLTRSPAEILASNSPRCSSDVADDANSTRACQLTLPNISGRPP